MKSISLLTTALLAAAVAASPAAAPDAADEIVQSTFSFAEWVETIIADPDTALSPDEALAAFNASIIGTADLAKRQANPTFGDCRTRGSGARAPASEAAWCVSWLAGRNKNCPLSSDYGPWALCSWYGAQVYTVRPGPESWQQIWCNEVARTAGNIMDHCTRGDGTVSGVAYPPNNNQARFAVELQAPQVNQIWQG